MPVSGKPVGHDRLSVDADNANSAGSGGSARGDSDRLRRNVACINCRNSKVRCKTSSVLGRPCQRCDRLGTSCVVDKAHRRVTKRSKLEQLEQELQSIKEAVHTKSPLEQPSWATPRRDLEGPPSQQQPRSDHLHVSSAPVALEAVQDPHCIGSPPPGFKPQTQTESRLLGQRLVTAAEIDWHFDKYVSFSSMSCISGIYLPSFTLSPLT
jgi:transcriptional regulatory protein LEU3